MRYIGLLVVAAGLVAAMSSAVLAQEFAVGGQAGYVFGGQGLFMYGVTGEASITGPFSVRAAFLFGSLRDPYSGFSVRMRWISGAGLYNVAVAEAEPYFGTGVGELSVSAYGISVGITVLDFIGGARFAMSETSNLFVEGHYMLPMGLPSGVQASGNFALTGGLLYSF
ncbi:MAG: hypothetical protein AB1609_20720 [Bacillota bacterium]